MKTKIKFPKFHESDKYKQYFDFKDEIPFHHKLDLQSIIVSPKSPGVFRVSALLNLPINQFPGRRYEITLSTTPVVISEDPEVTDTDLLHYIHDGINPDLTDELLTALFEIS